MTHRALSSTLLSSGSLVAALFAAATAAAHASHHGQSAYVTVGPEGVLVELDMSPGSQVARQVVALLDTDADGALSVSEERAYASAVLRDLSLEIDGRPEQLEISTLDFPPIEHLASGESKLSLSFVGPKEALSPGAHQLVFRNTHAPVTSAHQAHAIAADASIALGAPKRDASGDTLTATFTVTASPTGTRTTGHDASEERRPLWLGLLVGAPALLGVALQRRRKRSIP